MADHTQSTKQEKSQPKNTAALDLKTLLKIARESKDLDDFRRRLRCENKLHREDGSP